MKDPQPSFFDRLKQNADTEWHAYIEHPFVFQLAAGSLPVANFKKYLLQDYKFLIQFARAYGLGVYKAETLEDMRHCMSIASAILDTEIELHVRLCREWGLSDEVLENTPEVFETIAYTRFVLEAGLSGDALDLHTALSPCIIGYAEIANFIVNDSRTVIVGNPYRSWIEEYASAEYQAVANNAKNYIDNLAHKRLTEGRFPGLANTFKFATQLETEFWNMGLRVLDP